MRESCIECAAKHVGSALVLLSEARHGYDDHVILALGELEQAVQETELSHPALSEFIREARKSLTILMPQYLRDTEMNEERGVEAMEVEASLRKRMWSELLGQFVAGDSDGEPDITPGENV